MVGGLVCEREVERERRRQAGYRERRRGERAGGGPGSPAGAGHGLDPWRDLPDGLGPPLPGGGTGPPGHRRRVLDRPAHRHQRRVRPLRPQDRACDRGRAGGRPGRLPRRQAGAAGPGVHGVPQPGPAGRPGQPLQLVDLCARGRLAPPPGTSQLDQEQARPPGGPGRLGRRRRPMPPGPARSCPPRPNGSWPPAAAWTAPPTPGARSSTRGAAGWPTPGRASSPTRTWPWTGTRARPRWAGSRPTATAWTT